MELANIVTVIYNRSFKSGHIPSLWKRSCIIPIPKKSPISFSFHIIIRLIADLWRRDAPLSSLPMIPLWLALSMEMITGHTGS